MQIVLPDDFVSASAWVPKNKTRKTNNIKKHINKMKNRQNDNCV